MLRLLTTISQKLGLSEEHALLLFAFNKGWLNKFQMRRTYIVLTELVEKFDLKDTEYDESYAMQLLKRGILTPPEAAFFEGNYAETQENSAITFDYHD